jgi:hypothetical protein
LQHKQGGGGFQISKFFLADLAGAVQGRCLRRANLHLRSGRKGTRCQQGRQQESPAGFE